MKTVESKNRTQKRTEITTSSIMVLLFPIVKVNGRAEWREGGMATHTCTDDFVLCLARTCLPVRTHYGEFRRGLRPVRTNRAVVEQMARASPPASLLRPPPLPGGRKRGHRTAGCADQLIVRARSIGEWAGGGEGRHQVPREKVTVRFDGHNGTAAAGRRDGEGQRLRGAAAAPRHRRGRRRWRRGRGEKSFGPAVARGDGAQR